MVGAQPMGNQIVPSHVTYGKPHSPFYEGDHGNDDLPFIPVDEPLTRRVVSQGNASGNVIQAPKPSIPAGESTRWANLPIRAN